MKDSIWQSLWYKSLGLINTKFGVLKQVLICKHLFDKKGICSVEWSIVLRKELFAQIKNLLFWEGSWLKTEQTIVQVNDLWEGLEVNNEVVYWFVALFFWEGIS